MPFKKRYITIISVNIFIFMLVSCVAKEKRNKHLQVTFEKTLHNFQNVLNNTNTKEIIKYSNKEKSKLIIEKVTTSCSCTVVSLDSFVLNPNEEANMTITYNSNELGPFINIINVFYKGIDTPQKLMVQGNVVLAK